MAAVIVDSTAGGNAHDTEMEKIGQQREASRLLVTRKGPIIYPTTENRVNIRQLLYQHCIESTYFCTYNYIFVFFGLDSDRFCVPDRNTFVRGFGNFLTL